MFEPLSIIIYGVPLLLAIPLHEAAHGFVALRYGDNTAHRLGRVTLNPIKHIDPIGTVVFPGALVLLGSTFVFGWAKPVPVNFRALRNPRLHSIWVAAAGPAMNLLLALLSALALRLTGEMLPLTAGEDLPWWFEMLRFSIFLNVMLAVFNMVPLLPLDGGRVLNSLLPPKLAEKHAKTERYGFFVLIGFLVILPLLGIQFDIIRTVILPPVLVLMNGIMALAGFS